MGPEADTDTVKAVCHWIQWDDNRPHWNAGSEPWEAYMNSIDLWDIVTKTAPLSNA
jgi:hypothetical protein